MTQGATQQFKDILRDDDKSLSLFIKKMSEFDQTFCDLMNSGSDFNIRLEIRGNSRQLIHCRVSFDSTDRPEK